MSMTRQVRHAWTNGWGQQYPEYAIKREAFIHQMILEEKTDGLVIEEQDFVVLRFFSDQQAAEEWAAFLTQNAPVENPVTILEISPFP